MAALVSKKFLPLFNKWQTELANYGYNNFAQVLNASDYGVPQNRERVFLVSILDVTSYHFPQPFTLQSRLKDVLERSVDERYYLSDKILAGFNRTSQDASHRHTFTPKSGDDTAFALRTSAGTRVDDNFIQEPLNPDRGGLCRTIKAQYYKNGRANFKQQGGHGATGVIEYDNG